MIFSVNYHSKYKQQAQEIKCPINRLGAIFNFIKDNPDKRFNIITKGDTLSPKEQEQINLVKEITDNYTVSCGRVDILRDLLAQGYHAYLAFPATDWETFAELQDLGVSDIYIDGPLGFQMNKIAAGKKDIKIRVSPTMSPNSSLTKGEPNDFFIRPEDLKFYNSIDIIDFNETNTDKEDTLFSIYNRGTFNYSLQNLMSNLPYDINNLLFREDFVSHRLNCGQRCKEPNRSCHLCSNYFTVIKDSLNLIKRSN